jgi:hypothetical protein
MNLDEALERADKLAPSGSNDTLYAPGMNGHRCPEVLVREQLLSSEALGVLAAEVRRLREESRLFCEAGEAAEQRIAELREENAAQRNKLERVETLLPQLSKQARALRYGKSRRIANAQAIAIEGVAQQLKLALAGEP